MDETALINIDWLWAFTSICVGLVLGQLGGSLVRRALLSSKRSVLMQEAAAPAASVVFWCATAIGLFIAVNWIDSSVMSSINHQIRDLAPYVLAALALFIVGNAVSVVVATAVGQAARQATGVRNQALERSIRVLVLVIVALVALTQLGIDHTILVIIVAISLIAPVTILVIWSGVGALHVTRQLAAGRVAKQQIRVGDTLVSPDWTGTVVSFDATSVVLENDDDEVIHVPFQVLLEVPYAIQ